MSKILSNDDIIQQTHAQQKKRRRTRKEKIKITKEISLKDGITQKQEAPHTGNNRSRRTQ